VSRVTLFTQKILHHLPSNWWAWVLVSLAVLYLFNMASGSIYSRKLWNILHDQILKEDKAIQEEFEKEVTPLDLPLLTFLLLLISMVWPRGSRSFLLLSLTPDA
jgi:hypothetical protein